jgi:hypothetical protein
VAGAGGAALIPFLAVRERKLAYSCGTQNRENPTLYPHFCICVQLPFFLDSERKLHERTEKQAFDFFLGIVLKFVFS